ncbi:hypothetical protein J437_LFUL019706 [Ladona fulva]|nr:hypothetical protein J437_LFUL019706 [Ladona fulva]
MASAIELEVNEFESEKEIAAAPILEDSEREIENNGVNDVESDKSEHLARLPISRVRHIMKLDPDVNMATQEAVYLVCKATELFIESLARESCSFTVQSKKKTIQRRDIDASIGAVEALSFLDGALD